MKVLIVDDELDILNILEDIIEEKFMCEVDKAENGLDAFLLCRENEYNFIINYDKTEKNNFSYVDSYLGDYLNFNVYSEHDHEKRQYEMEIG